MANLRFLCARNRLRSLTAEQVFASWPGVETAFAGMTTAVGLGYANTALRRDDDRKIKL